MAGSARRKQKKAERRARRKSKAARWHGRPASDESAFCPQAGHRPYITPPGWPGGDLDAFGDDLFFDPWMDYGWARHLPPLAAVILWPGQDGWIPFDKINADFPANESVWSDGETTEELVRSMHPHLTDEECHEEARRWDRHDTQQHAEKLERFSGLCQRIGVAEPKVFADLYPFCVAAGLVEERREPTAAGCSTGP